MKVIELSNKVYLVRHWFKWYRVQRGGAQWDELAPIIKAGRLPRKSSDPISDAAESLRKARPSDPITPPIDLTK
jgi:hypothetical protein